MTRLDLGLDFRSWDSLQILPQINLWTVRGNLGVCRTGKFQIYACFLPWAAYCPMFESSIWVLWVVLGESYTNVFTLNISIKIYGKLHRLSTPNNT